MANLAMGGEARGSDSWVVKTEQPDSPLTLELNVAGMDGASLSVDMDREHVLALVAALQEITSIKDGWSAMDPGGKWIDVPESMPLTDPADVKSGDWLRVRGTANYAIRGMLSFIVDHAYTDQYGDVVWETLAMTDLYAKEWEVLEWKSGYSN